MRKSSGRRESASLIIPALKSLAIDLVDFRHLLDGEGEAVCNRRDVVDLVQRQHPALARLQVFVEHLIRTFILNRNGHINADLICDWCVNIDHLVWSRNRHNQ